MFINRNKEILLSLGLACEESIERYADRVRDREDVGVLFDANTGIIFLDRSDHLDIAHYEEIEGGNYWGAPTREEALKKYAFDDGRRFEQFKKYITGKDVVDIGCGTGGFLDYAKDTCNMIAGVEPQQEVRNQLQSLGYEIYRLPEDVPPASFDVVTLFHTLEHLIEPLEVLKNIKSILKPGGTLIVEIPHARDALFALENFRNFSLWSEHMILHTKESLAKFLEVTGFIDIDVFGYQRYPMTNHLGWLATGLPGGQKLFPSNQNNASYNNFYEDLLVANDKTDTIIAIAKV